jgi:hypothetical protein
VRLHYVYPYPSVDALMPLMAEGKILPYLDVPFQHASPRILKAMKRPASAENNLERCARGGHLPGDHGPQHLHHRFPRRDRGRVRGMLLAFIAEARSTASAASPIRRSTARRPMSCPARCRRRCARNAGSG